MPYYFHHRFKILAILLAFRKVQPHEAACIAKRVATSFVRTDSVGIGRVGVGQKLPKNRSYPKWMKNHIFTNFDTADPNINFVFMHLLPIPFKSCYNVQIGYFFEIFNQNEKIRGKCICLGYPGTHTVHKTIVIIYIFELLHLKKRKYEMVSFVFIVNHRKK